LIVALAEMLVPACAVPIGAVDVEKLEKPAIVVNELLNDTLPVVKPLPGVPGGKVIVLPVVVAARVCVDVFTPTVMSPIVALTPLLVAEELDEELFEFWLLLLVLLELVVLLELLLLLVLVVLLCALASPLPFAELFPVMLPAPLLALVLLLVELLCDLESPLPFAELLPVILPAPLLALVLLLVELALPLLLLVLPLLLLLVVSAWPADEPLLVVVLSLLLVLLLPAFAVPLPEPVPVPLLLALPLPVEVP
jgi:hypothetical protein